MKMKKIYIFTILLFVHTIFHGNVIAQEYIQRNLPDGAVARLGKGKVNGIQISPDGSQIAIGSSSGVWLYDANTGAELALFTNHTSQFGHVAFSPDGKTLASGLFKDILLWDIATGNQLNSFKNDIGRIKALSFTEDSKSLQCENHIDSVKLWDITTGKKKLDFRPKSLDSLGRALKLLSGSDHTASDLFLNKENRGIYALGYEDGKIRLEDATTGKLLNTFQGHKNHIHQLVFSPDGNLLVSNISSDSLRMWDVNTGQQIEALIDDPKIDGILMFSKDGKTLVCQRKSNELVLWDVATKSHRCSLDIHLDGTIKVLSFSKDYKKIIGASSLGEIRIWNTKTGNELFTFKTEHTQLLTSLAFSPEGNRFASGYLYSIRVWNISTPIKLYKHIKTTGFPQALVFSPEGNTVTNVDSFTYNKKINDGIAKESLVSTLSVWDISMGQKQSDFPIKSYNETKVQGKATSTTHRGLREAIAFSQNGYMLATVQNVERATEDNRFTVLTWDVPNGEIHYTLKGHTDKIKALAFTPNGKTLASGGEDGTVRIWDVSTGTQMFNLPLGKTGALAITADGKILATTNSPFKIQLWDIENGKEMTPIQGQNGTVEILAFSPDSGILASSGRDGKIRLWDITTNKKLSTVNGHTTDIKELIFSVDGKTLASGSSDGLVFLWDVENVCGGI